jgi:hypothetical protein
MSNFMKIRPVGAQLFRADRWTDAQDKHAEANSRFSQFWETRLKKVKEGKKFSV